MSPSLRVAAWFPSVILVLISTPAIKCRMQCNPVGLGSCRPLQDCNYVSDVLVRHCVSHGLDCVHLLQRLYVPGGGREWSRVIGRQLQVAALQCIRKPCNGHLWCTVVYLYLQQQFHCHTCTHAGTTWRLQWGYVSKRTDHYLLCKFSIIPKIPPAPPLHWSEEGLAIYIGYSM